MTGFRTSHVFPTGLDLPTSSPIETQLAAMPSLRGWWRADEGTNPAWYWVKKAGAASGNAGTFFASAPYVAGTGTLNGESALVFDGSNDFATVAGNYTTNGVFSWALIFSAPAGNNKYIMSAWDAVNGTGTFLYTTDAGLIFQHGSGQILMPHVANGRTVFVGSSDQLQIHARRNGVQYDSDDHNNAASVGAGLYLGAAYHAGGTTVLPSAPTIADVFTFQGDIFQDVQSLELIERYAALRYAITLPT